MNVKRFLSVSVLATACAFSFGSVSAQTLARDNGPAELPPASFTANQYVDSKGCVYIRAGVDGNTNWVPRVSRTRKVVCGLTPSLRSGGTSVAAAPSAPAPVQIGAAAAAAVVAPKSPAPTAIRPAPTTAANVLAPRPVRTIASKPVVKQRISPTVQTARAPRPSTFQQAQPRRVEPARIQTQPRVVRVAPTAQTTQTRRVATTQRGVQGTPTCRGDTVAGQRFLATREGARRCRLHQQSSATRAGNVQAGALRAANGQVMNTVNVSPNAIVAPRHVYEQQQAARVVSPTPKGYRKAWEDDRLNSKRAHQTLNGKAKTDVIWSQTVPRRLIVRETGRDVTRFFPGLRYPYTSEAQQNADWKRGVQVMSTKGQAPKRLVKPQAVRQQKAVAPRKPAAQVVGKQYVQVGTFGVAGNAQNTAARIQRMGLPVRIGKFTRGGKQMRIVLAGPFKSSAHVNGALRAVRNAGFRDAFARN